jgi:hypothetical protein
MTGYFEYNGKHSWQNYNFVMGNNREELTPHDSLMTVYQNNCKMPSFNSICPREHPRSI